MAVSPDFRGESLQILKEKGEESVGEYRTLRLVLGAWERLGQ